MGYSFIPLWLRVVASSGGQPALSDISRTRSYAELHAEAAAIAAFLLKKEIREQGVIVSLHDKLHSITAFLGILLSGNHYFFINPDLLEYYLNQFPELRAMPVLTDTQANLSNRVSNRVILFSEAVLPGKGYSSPQIPAPESPFAIFSTSGSTGAPKLVRHSQQYLLADTMAQIERFPIGPNDKRDYYGSLMFSASAGAIFPILLAGGHLVLFDFQKSGALALPQLWEEAGITLTTVPASVLRLLTKAQDLSHRLSKLKILIISAEAVQPEDLELFSKRLPPALTFMNGYAATETRGITLACYQNNGAPSDPAGSVGRPWLDKRILVVDDSGEEVQQGKTGEIVVEAHGLPGGYLFGPAADAFTTIPDGKIRYKTGDIGFLDESGRLYLSGRKDFVVKINGIKVNLQQIEAAFQQFPPVREAAVILDKNQRLQAFFAASEDFSLDQCQSFLKSKLPPHMLPAGYTLLDSLPKTITGKIDRKSLPAAEHPYNPAPRSPHEQSSILQSITGIWEKELGLSYAVRAEDDFFKDLGGDSLLCAVCTETLEKELGIRLDINAMYTYTTPASLEQFILKLKNNLAAVVPINQADPARPTLYFIPPYPGDRRTYRYLEEALHDTYNLYFLYYNPVLPDQSIAPFGHLVKALADSIQPASDISVAGYSFGGMLAYFVCKESENNKRPIKKLVLLDTPLYRQFSRVELGYNFSVRVARKFRQFLTNPDDIWQRFVIQFRKTYRDYSGRFTAEKFKEDPLNPVQVVWHYVQSFPERQSLAADIVLFRAKELPVAYQFKWDYNWKKHTKGNLHTYWLAGWHENAVNDPDNAQIVARHLQWNGAGSELQPQLRTDG
ncbi:hypothetical protein GCM10023091_27580 [Ravibacter arvi]|uniref:Carrier domain-containing protein n=1 Tax=Ravibacter arvi TaxID=2051041 RepID=A0ABP8M134_9BACT